MAECQRLHTLFLARTPLRSPTSPLVNLESIQTVGTKAAARGYCPLCRKTTPRLGGECYRVKPLHIIANMQRAASRSHARFRGPTVRLRCSKWRRLGLSLPILPNTATSPCSTSSSNSRSPTSPRRNRPPQTAESRRCCHISSDIAASRLSSRIPCSGRSVEACRLRCWVPTG
jgi:hypothetical protein